MTQRPLITTRFDGSSTAEEVIAGVDLHGLRAVVTGASSGIGAETARVLATAGADVTLAVRDTTVGARVADRIAASAGEPLVAVAAIDLADPGSVARFARDWDGPLHLLVNNAGLVTGGLERTKEGWELQFATNHLGHFALAWALHDALAQGARDRGTARIVSLSSAAHMRARSTSTTSTSNAGLTTRRSRTPSRRPRTRCSPSRRPDGGAPRASWRTP